MSSTSDPTQNPTASSTSASTSEDSIRRLGEGLKNMCAGQQAPGDSKKTWTIKEFDVDNRIYVTRSIEPLKESPHSSKDMIHLCGLGTFFDDVRLTLSRPADSDKKSREYCGILPLCSVNLISTGLCLDLGLDVEPYSLTERPPGLPTPKANIVGRTRLQWRHKNNTRDHISGDVLMCTPPDKLRDEIQEVVVGEAELLVLLAPHMDRDVWLGQPFCEEWILHCFDLDTPIGDLLYLHEDAKPDADEAAA